MKLSKKRTENDLRPLTESGREELAMLACIEVAKQFPGLSTYGFFAEVSSRLWPWANEDEIKGPALRLVSEGILEYTVDWKVRLVEKPNSPRCVR